MRVLTYRMILKHQDELNEAIIEDWKNRLTKDDFRAAIVSELAELQDSIPWKWWKKSSPIDEQNVRIEVIDILHFYISNLCLGHSEYMHVDKLVCSVADPNLAVRVVNSGQLDTSMFVYHVQKLLSENNISTIDNFLVDMGVSGEAVSAYYIAKKALNLFRQQNDYATGEYQKVVNGVEDNKILEKSIQEFLENNAMTLATLEKNVARDLAVAYGTALV